MDIPTFATVISLALALGTFFLGRITAGRESGREAGSMETDMRHIKSSLDRIEKRLGDDVNRLEGRIDQISKEQGQVQKDLASVQKDTKSAHRRMDEHLQREHNQ